MPAYVYRARDPMGQMVMAKLEADSERELIIRLRSQGLLVLEVERDRDIQSVLHQPNSFFSRAPDGKELAVLARQFATMINAGLPVVAGLKVLANQTSNRRLRAALHQVTSSVEGGESLAGAFARHGALFPAVMVQMIAAGEVGGILDDVLARLATQLEKEEIVRQKVRSAMVYPTIVSCVAALVVTLLVTIVVPQFVAVYAELGAELPLLTRLLIAVSGWAQRFWWLLLALGLGGAAAIRHGLRTDAGITLWHHILLKLPVFGPMAAKHAVARFARTLSGLLSSGVTILKALAVVERVVGNRVIAAAVRNAFEEVRQGQGLVAPLRASAFFPPMMLELLSVGEETGTTEEMLTRLADFYEEDVQRTAERLSASLEPLIIVGLGLTVGFIVISMMLPIFNLWTAVSQMG